MCFKTHYESDEIDKVATKTRAANATARKSALSRMLTTPSRNCDFYVFTTFSVYPLSVLFAVWVENIEKH